MARPSLTLLDSFTRADGAPGANWVNEPFNDSPSAYSIVSNVLMSTSHSDMYWASSFTQASGGKIGVGATIAGTLPTKTASGGFEGFYLEIVQQPSASSNTCDGYQVGLRRRTGTDTLTIWKYTNVGVAATLIAETNLATNLVAGDTFDFTCDTNGNLEVFRNGTSIATVQDTASPVYFPAAATGIFCGISIVTNAGTGNTGWDDFYGGQVSAGTTTVSKTLTPSYNVRSILTKGLSPAYNVKVTATKALSASYTVRKAITKTVTPTYSVIQRLAKSFTASYAVVAAPVNTVLPVISGTPQSGQTLSVSNGTWTNTPTGYTYQWQVETAPGSGVYTDIPGETANTLAL